MLTPGIQLYSLRNVDEPLPTILDRVANAGFDTVEFAYRVYDEETDAVRQTIERTDLEVAGAHVGIDRLEDDFEATVDLFRSFGAETLTIPSLDAEYFQSREGIESAAARLLDIADNADAHGLDLLYHNHTHEFVDLDGTYALEHLFAETGDRVRPQVDIGHVIRAGGDPSALLRRLGDVPQAHVVDANTETGELTRIGDGDVDLAAITSVLRDVDCACLLYEHEDTDLEDTAANLRRLCSE